MSDDGFFDTNILLYTFNDWDREKQVRPGSCFATIENKRLVVSTQVVQESYMIGARKLDLPREELQEEYRICSQ